MKLAMIGVGLALAGLMAGAAQASDGQAIYAQHCAVCHNKIPPKLGDKAAWAPRLKAGMDVLVAAAVKGKGHMPPQVGKSGLSEADVRAAVEYLVAHSK